MSTLTGKTADVKLLKEIAEALRVKHNLRYFFDVNDGESCNAKLLALKKAWELRPQTLARLIDADPMADEHSLELVWVREWIGLVSGREAQRRWAALAIFGCISETCAKLPIFDHNCLHCIHLGAMQRVQSAKIDAPMAFPHVVDLYACRGHDGFTFVARYGDKASEYIDSGDRLTPNEPHLAEALRRTHGRGLFAA